VAAALFCLGAATSGARAACNPAICAGTTCTISGTHNLDPDCVLDFTGKNVTIGSGAVLQTADYETFTIIATNLVHRGLLRARGGEIYLQSFGSFTTQDVGGQAGRINLNGPDVDEGGYLEVVAAGAVTIGSNVTATGGAGSFWVEGCAVTLAGTLDVSGGSNDGVIEITYHGSLTAQSGAILAGTDVADGATSFLYCPDNGAGDCTINPAGLACNLGTGVCSSGSTTLTPSAELSAESLGPCVGCGNHVLEPGEACDEGDVDPCDGCSPTCQPQDIGATCDDGNPCTTSDVCSGGACAGGPRLGCGDDGNPCTDDVCQDFVGCLHPPKPNGTSCSDGSICNGAETCQGGACAPGTALDCNDGNSCTADSCHPTNGCVHDLSPPCAAALVSLIGELLNPVCGDGVREGEEACDDGNTSAGDCCSATCDLEAAGTLCGVCSGCPCPRCDGAGICR
jgi:cysteine-rich repeat protein